VYDVRIRRECIKQLRTIFMKYGQSSLSLDSMLESFKHRNKDFVFLVNIQSSMTEHLDRV
jgi:hypothetical protein